MNVSEASNMKSKTIPKQKGLPFHFFDTRDVPPHRLHDMRLFENFSMLPKGPPPFLIFCNSITCYKTPKGSRFKFLDTETVQFFSIFISKISSSYKWSTSIFFIIFCNRMQFQKAQRPPFSILKTIGYSAGFGCSRFVFCQQKLENIPKNSR